MGPQLQALHPVDYVGASLDPGERGGTAPGDLPSSRPAINLVGREHLGVDYRLAALWLLLPPVSSSPRLATSEAPDAMEEWDVPQMKKEVESLKYQLAFKREMSSKTIPE